MTRALTAYAGDPPRARSSQERIFDEEGFDRLLTNIDDSNVALAYFALKTLEDGTIGEAVSELPSHSIRYGKYAMLFAVARVKSVTSLEPKEVIEEAKKLILTVVAKWDIFESEVEKKASNTKYRSKNGFNFDGYYKGGTVTDDIRAFSWY